MTHRTMSEHSYHGATSCSKHYIKFMKIKAHENVESAWTKYGVLFAKLKSHDRIKKIVNMDDCLTHRYTNA